MRLREHDHTWETRCKLEIFVEFAKICIANPISNNSERRITF